MADFESYKIKLQGLFNGLVEEFRLFPNTLQYIPNENNTGYSIKIFEEDYPPARENVPHENRRGVYSPSAVALVKEIQNDREYNGMLKVTVPEYTLEFSTLPASSIQVSESASEKISFIILPDANDLMPYLKKMIEYRIKHYHSTQNSFGCCSRFNECSDAKQCVHYNQLYSTGCIYRSLHLDKGEIFYGKNRNTD